MTGALDGVRIFDMTRILAGPTCTQVLGDLGADVIKIEKPGSGDDTRHWAPPYLRDKAGNDTAEAAYFLAANRNKRSLTLDVAKPQGQEIARRLIAKCDVMVENFKAGNLARYGLGYEDLREEFPSLIYCSVTGFGQTGPYAPRPGYDFLAQAMGGIMSLTGEPDGAPAKVGIGIADQMCGMYATVSVLAALRHRDATGQGQHIDMALLDTQVAWLSYEAENFLVSGKRPTRVGNAHPNIVPYDACPTSDGHVIVAAGNDRQFRIFCEFAGAPELADDPDFESNDKRIRNRDLLMPRIKEITAKQPMQYWIDGLIEAGVPCCPVNTVDRVFEDPQVKARDMRIELDHPAAEDLKVPLVASPIKMSATPPSHRRPPPMLGQHTEEVLRELLEMGDGEIVELRNAEVV